MVVVVNRSVVGEVAARPEAGVVIVVRDGEVIAECL
jgi:hypothetical protein